jgi:hypothetical protein
MKKAKKRRAKVYFFFRSLFGCAALLTEEGGREKTENYSTKVNMRANFSSLANEESEILHLMRGDEEEVPYARSQQVCSERKI